MPPEPEPAGTVPTTTAQGSVWLRALPAVGYPPLHGEAVADVAVIGAGITGLTTALLLKHAGLRVVVLEAGRVGAGVSGNNTAKVTALQATVYSTITARHGQAAAADYAAASLAGVELVATLTEREGIECELQRRPAYTYAISERERGTVAHEAATARAAGLRAVLEEHSSLDVPFPTYGAVRLDEQLLLHPLRYVSGLAAAVDGGGCRVHEHSRVLKVREGQPCRIHTAGGVLSAERVVVATHYPLLDRGLHFARLETARSYCIAARLRTGAPPVGLAISAGSPSWSLSRAGDLLIVAGQSHCAGQRGVGTRSYDRLAAFASQHWDVDAVIHRWSAQDSAADDKLPLIGSYTQANTRLYLATAYQKWGLSTGTFAAIAIAGQITGTPPSWADRFTPHRIDLRAVPDLVRINAKVAMDLVGDRLNPAHTRPEQIPPGQAGVIRDGLDRTGVYRDPDGILHAVSMRCTHLGCLVRFNQAERSWDCPCHGSRFDVDGTVLEGPATSPLPRRTLSN